MSQESAVEEARAIAARYANQKANLIQILQDVQNESGYLAEPAVAAIAEELNISPSLVFGIATFYTQFKFNRPGRNTIKVCRGTACHVRGASDLMESVERQLVVAEGETSEDGEFSLDRVACLGCCALAPVVTVNDQVNSKMTQRKVTKLLGGLRGRDE